MLLKSQLQCLFWCIMDANMLVSHKFGCRTPPRYGFLSLWTSCQFSLMFYGVMVCEGAIICHVSGLQPIKTDGLYVNFMLFWWLLVIWSEWWVICPFLNHNAFLCIWMDTGHSPEEFSNAVEPNCNIKPMYSAALLYYSYFFPKYNKQCSPIWVSYCHHIVKKWHKMKCVYVH